MFNIITNYKEIHKDHKPSDSEIILRLHWTVGMVFGDSILDCLYVLWYPLKTRAQLRGILVSCLEEFKFK